MGISVQDTEEATWIRLAQTGDREAFANLVKHYWGRIHRWLLGVTGCAHVAEDLTQEVFIKAWQALPTYQQQGQFRAWLFRIARNRLIDHQRASQTKLAATLPDQLASREPGPLAQLLSQEHQETIAEACRALPESVRGAFLLWVQEEMPYEEIAMTLNITEVTARWRVCKARQLLLRMLASPGGRKQS